MHLNTELAANLDTDQPEPRYRQNTEADLHLLLVVLFFLQSFVVICDHHSAAFFIILLRIQNLHKQLKASSKTCTRGRVDIYIGPGKHHTKTLKRDVSGMDLELLEKIRPFTYIQDGGESGWGNTRADGGEDRPADLSDVAAWPGQQGQQEVHHHLHPLWLLLRGCKEMWINLIWNLLLLACDPFGGGACVLAFSNQPKTWRRRLVTTSLLFVPNSNSLCFFFFLAFFS